MQHPKHKSQITIEVDLTFSFFPFVLLFSCLQDMVVQTVIGWQHMFWLHSQLPLHNYRHTMLYNCKSFSFFFFFLSTLTCANLGQYKHSIFVENKHFMYTCQTTRVTFTPLQDDNKWMDSQLQATADLNKQTVFSSRKV